MIHLYLIRHGDIHSKGKYIGRGTDLPLSKMGEQQIRGISSLLNSRNIKPDKIYTSSQLRARQSSEILEESFGIQSHTLPGLEETDFGRWEGLSYDEILKSDAVRLQEWIDDPVNNKPPSGESLQDLKIRVEECSSKWEDLRISEEEQHIFVVSHRGPLSLLLLRYLGCNPDRFWSFRIDRGSISKVNLYPRFSELAYLNLTAVP